MVWSTGEKVGVVIAAVVCGVGLFAALWYVCAARQKRRRLERDMEKGSSGGGAGERRRGKRSRTRKKASMSEKGPGGIEGIEGVEMGPAARRSLHGEASSTMARKGGEPRGSRRSGDPRASGRTRHEEGSARAPVGEVRSAARGVVVAPPPVGQRPLRPPAPNQGSRIEATGRELVNRAGPSVLPVRMEVVKAPASHNALVDDDDSDDMVSNHF